MISKARELLGFCRIDENKCRAGINGLHEFDASRRGVHSNSNRSTDIVEAFCYMAMEVKTGRQRDFIDFNIWQHRKVINDYNALER